MIFKAASLEYIQMYACDTPVSSGGWSLTTQNLGERAAHCPSILPVQTPGNEGTKLPYSSPSQPQKYSHTPQSIERRLPFSQKHTQTRRHTHTRTQSTLEPDGKKLRLESELGTHTSPLCGGTVGAEGEESGHRARSSSREAV